MESNASEAAKAHTRRYSGVFTYELREYEHDEHPRDESQTSVVQAKENLSAVRGPMVGAGLPGLMFSARLVATKAKRASRLIHENNAQTIVPGFLFGLAAGDPVDKLKSSASRYDLRASLPAMMLRGVVNGRGIFAGAGAPHPRSCRKGRQFHEAPIARLGQAIR